MAEPAAIAAAEMLPKKCNPMAPRPQIVPRHISSEAVRSCAQAKLIMKEPIEGACYVLDLARFGSGKVLSG
jgi:hypothetical protein